MKIQLSDHFTYKRMLRFTLPSIIMMVFTSLYSVADGFFVSRFTGKIPFASINFITPVLTILGSVGFMFGAGGNALIGKTMGEGNNEKANRIFSLMVCVIAALGIILAICASTFLRPLASFLGADGQMLDNCILYGRIVLISLPLHMLQYGFHHFFITAEKPQIGLYFTVASGITNVILDALFMIVFKWGIVGAASATVISQIIGGGAPILYFSIFNKSRLRFTKPAFDTKSLIKSATNGCSELMNNAATAIVSILYNIQLIKYAGENGVAAHGVLSYLYTIFLATYIGYCTGISPVISYHHGAGHYDELKGLLRKSLIIIGCFSITMFTLSESLAFPLSYIFVGYDAELMELTQRVFLICSFSFLFAGFAIFGSSFFTALNDGVTSAIIAFLRALVFEVATILIFPLIWGIDGIWFSLVSAEIIVVTITTVFVFAKRNKFKYF